MCELKILLGIETSTEVGSLALLQGGEVRASEKIDTYLSHSAHLLSRLDSLLRRVGVRVNDLEGIGVGLGPGSFTGLRVGLAAGKGLAYALKIPLAGVSSFAALAQQFIEPGGTVAVISDARRGRLYGALYRREGGELRDLKPPAIISYDEIVKFASGALIVSPHWDRLRPRWEEEGGELRGKQAFPRAEEVAALAEEKLKKNPAGEISSAAPIYLSTYQKKSGEF